MDSLTQIVLGAAVGEAVLGKKIGNKAMLYGAIAGTIPDLDTFASFYTDTVTGLELHRGFTHSVLFSVLFAPIFAWLVTRFEKYKDFKGWCWLFFLAFVTHPILDAHTTWGTQLFWPLENRLAFKTIFVVDPLYTIPFLVFLILTMFQKKTDPKRRKYNNLGLIISSSYLALTFALKGAAFYQFKKQLEEQNIAYTEIETKPSPLNTILWTANVETKNAYYIGHYSFFDTKPIKFSKYTKNHHLLGDLLNNTKVQRMIAISKGWYTVDIYNDNLYFNDLRFGTLSMNYKAHDFVFSYKINTYENGTIVFEEKPKNRAQAKKLLADLWQRIKGN
ncbi:MULTISPECIES: metal-dependent hydrolase [unclassified Cellulophaga]|uniref:metal-dependent hydrolase n=1 Tax=unclassified Cellulophaga TaxID=2634405 RepID=UPI0026E13A44|nr:MULTISPECIES: metal-dependent hydrolase [unclassified Cellulophaga]MDO6490835.1 metal-dependent hydrolase [Cellulophaga sp. 2_MG-2023]MDO6493971.1 metal-dependent hydrolase [Cellulophaga sp. 3_MG-2023]